MPPCSTSACAPPDRDLHAPRARCHTHAATTAYSTQGQITTLCLIGLVLPPLKDSHRTAAFRTPVPQVRTLPPLEYHYFFQYLLSRAPLPGISAHRIHISLGIGEGLILYRAGCIPSYGRDSLLSWNPALSVSVVDLTDHWESERLWNAQIASKGRLPTSAAAEYFALFSTRYQFLHLITALGTQSPRTLCCNMNQSIPAESCYITKCFETM